MAESSSSETQPLIRDMLRLDFLALLSAVAVFGFSLGVSYPMLGLAMENMGLSGTWIGLNSTMTAVGILISSFWLPVITGRLGAYAIISGSLIITSFCFLAFGFFYDPDVWLGLRIVMGVAINGLFMLSETWVNMISNDNNRGRFIGVYATVLAASFAAGPMMVPVLGYEGLTPFVVCAVVVAAGLVPIFKARKQIPDMHSDDGHLSLVKQLIKGPPLVLSYIVQVPTLMGAILLLAFVDFAAFSLMPSYAVRSGVDQFVAPYFVATVALGNVFLQFPLGWLSDRINRYSALILCGVVTMVGALLIPMVVNSYLVWPVLFFWGGTAYGLMTIAIGILGTRYQGATLVSANAATAIAWGVGGLFGPSLGGYAMDLAGPQALMWVVAFACLIFLCVAIYRHPGALGAGRA